MYSIAQDDVLAELRTCLDPELSTNIVDLGLVYGIEITPNSEGTADILVRLTLTSQGCPMSNVISSTVLAAVQRIPGVHSARIQFVWEPAWHPGLISEAGRRQLQIAHT